MIPKKRTIVTALATALYGSSFAQPPLIADVGSLDGRNGFSFSGVDYQTCSHMGRAVAAAGDMNGDGFDDVAMGAPFLGWGCAFEEYNGQVSVIFGSNRGFPADFQPDDINQGGGPSGFVRGGGSGEYLGVSISSAGDINGDGFDDLIYGATGTDPEYSAHDAGRTYIVLGAESCFSCGKFYIDGINEGDRFGEWVSGAGDMNGDGLDDLVIGSFVDRSYVIFGATSWPSPAFDLSSLNGTNGFVVGAESELFGHRVAGVGDVNGDGLDDVIIGVPGAIPGGKSRAGSSYVVFGSTSAFPVNLEVSALNGVNGFAINGVAADDRSGASVGDAGDVNGDGVDDLVIGTAVNRAYVVFGNKLGYTAEFELSALNGTNGFVIQGPPGESLGHAVDGAGDVNGDGVDDLIMGAVRRAYLLFGSAGGFAASIDLAAQIGVNALVLDGPTEFSGFGHAVGAAGDVNGDGVADLIIGAPWERGQPELPGRGQGYVFFSGEGLFGDSFE